MTNSPLIDRKIEEAYGIIRERSEKKKDRVEKKVCADGGCSCSDCCSYWILCGKSGLGKRTASDRQRDRTGTGAAGVPGDTDRRNCNAGTNRARNIQCRGERRGWGQQYRSHWDPEYGNQCGSYRTGAVSGIGSGLHHYLDGLLCHKPGNFPGGKMESEEGFPEMSANSDGKARS